MFICQFQHAFMQRVRKHQINGTHHYYSVEDKAGKRKNLIL